MKRQPSLAVVDDLARLAGDAEPPALDEISTHRMLDAAMRSSSSARAETPRRWMPWALGALACSAAALFVIFALRAPKAAEPDLMRATLPTGDRIVGTAGARFAIEELELESRRLRVQSGAMVFDVAHVAEGQRFEVTTDDAVVRATGTVFSVSVVDASTRVHVFEGSVEVAHAGTRIPLVAGTSWSSRDKGADAAPIRAAGETFARERSALAVVPAVPEPQPQPEPEPEPQPQPELKPQPQPELEPQPSPAPTSTPSPTASPTLMPTPTLSPSATPRPTPAPAASPSATPTARATPSRTSTSAAAQEQPAVAAAATIETARADIQAGRYYDALSKAAATMRTGASGEWDLVRGDALRALRRTDEAAAAFESAAKSLTAHASISAAYTAAYLRYHDLHDGERALANLTGVDDKGSPFEERGLVLRAKILTSLDRKHEAAVIAARYLDRFPKGSSAQLMRALSNVL